jgi:hypothetical protein
VDVLFLVLPIPALLFSVVIPFAPLVQSGFNDDAIHIIILNNGVMDEVSALLYGQILLFIDYGMPFLRGGLHQMVAPIGQGFSEQVNCFHDSDLLRFVDL